MQCIFEGEHQPQIRCIAGRLNLKHGQKMNKIDVEDHDAELGGVITPNGYFKKA